MKDLHSDQQQPVKEITNNARDYYPVQDMRTQMAAAREAYHRRTAPPTRRVHFAVLVEVMVPTGDELEKHSTVTFKTKPSLQKKDPAKKEKRRKLKL
ncbi:hypothetical protein BASA81_009305 [Batrachochytrium salamandrivorans]|nr:hypothetical protein BASA81_009305 [Batrachochytrium salamandrivorans]